MTLKFGLVVLALIVAWYVLVRPSGSGSEKRPEPRRPAPMAMEACPRCGVYRSPGGACKCTPGTADET